MHISSQLLDLDSRLIFKTSFQPLERRFRGSCDEKYVERRKELFNIVAQYKLGRNMPEVLYNEEERATWSRTYKELKKLYRISACKRYLDCFDLFEAQGLIGSTDVPNIRDISEALSGLTGFRLYPVTGAVNPRDFLVCLSCRLFPCTMYIRHNDAARFTNEPDYIHELLGHVIMLADDKFADLSQFIGERSVGASDDDVRKIATAYFYMMEFGLCKEDGAYSAIGAALLSSSGEIQYALSEESKKYQMNLEEMSSKPYDDNNYQPQYYACDSLVDLNNQFRSFLKQLEESGKNEVKRVQLKKT